MMRPPVSTLRLYLVTQSTSASASSIGMMFPTSPCHVSLGSIHTHTHTARQIRKAVLSSTKTIQEVALIIRRMQQCPSRCSLRLSRQWPAEGFNLSVIRDYSLLGVRRRSANVFSTGVLPIYPRFPDRDVHLESLRLAPHQTSNWPGTFPREKKKGCTVLCCAVHSRRGRTWGPSCRSPPRYSPALHNSRHMALQMMMRSVCGRPRQTKTQSQIQTQTHSCCCAFQRCPSASATVTNHNVPPVAFVFCAWPSATCTCIHTRTRICNTSGEEASSCSC